MYNPYLNSSRSMPRPMMYWMEATSGASAFVISVTRFSKFVTRFMRILVTRSGHSIYLGVFAELFEDVARERDVLGVEHVDMGVGDAEKSLNC